MHVQLHDRQQLSSLVVKEPYSSSQPLMNNIYNSQQQLIIKNKDKWNWMDWLKQKTITRRQQTNRLLLAEQHIRNPSCQLQCSYCELREERPRCRCSQCRHLAATSIHHMHTEYTDSSNSTMSFSFKSLSTNLGKPLLNCTVQILQENNKDHQEWKFHVLSFLYFQDTAAGDVV